MEISNLIKKRIIEKEYDYTEILDLVMQSLNNQDEAIIDYMENHDYFECYGYTEKFKDEIEFLKEHIELNILPENFPKNINIFDKMKLDLFLENFSKISLEEIEGLLGV